jgi:hypothetical protein
VSPRQGFNRRLVAPTLDEDCGLGVGANCHVARLRGTERRTRPSSKVGRRRGDCWAWVVQRVAHERVLASVALQGRRGLLLRSVFAYA